MLTKIAIAASALILSSAIAFADNATLKPAVSNGALPQQCNQLFNETEQLIKEAEKQPGTHTQFATIKNKLSQSKKQILALEREVQIKSCDKGLVALNNIKKQQLQP